MTAYQEFVNTLEIESEVRGKFSWLWELEVDGNIKNLLDFSREFLRQKGFEYTGYIKDKYGNVKAIFNDKYIFDGVIQESSKVAIKISQI